MKSALNRAPLLARRRGGHRRVARVCTLLDELDVGLVTVDPGHDLAHVNVAAATILGIPAGDTTASEFGEAVDRLARRACDPAETLAELRRLRFGRDTELKTTWQFPDAPTHLGIVCKIAARHGFDGQMWMFYDNSRLAEAIESASQVSNLLRISSDAMLDPQVLVEAVRSEGPIVDLVYREVNRAACGYLGLPRAELVGHSLVETFPGLAESGLMDAFVNCADTGEPVVLDGIPYHSELLGDLRYYDIRATQASQDFISLTWRDVTERSELTARIALSEERFRLLADNVADVVVRIRNETISWISRSVSEALGAPAGHWIGVRAEELIPPEDRANFSAALAAVDLDGRYKGRARVRGADGVTHWVHLHVKRFHEADGTPNGAVASFRVIDEEVAAEELALAQIAERDAQNRSLNRRLQAQTTRLMAELGSAARYVTSILPSDMTGPVPVTSRYVPSQELGGDSFDHRWIDDDHLIVYLVDVSGHGVEPAMVSVSVHNLLRSGTLDHDVLLHPDRVLTELNRLFQMDQQAGNYFTIWYGVYQPSTRTLRYAGAGHPPAIVLTPDGADPVRLPSDSVPVGVLEETTFETRSVVLPPVADVLLYSDGAFDLFLPDGRPWTLDEFIDLCARTAASPKWTLDRLINKLRKRSESGLFTDDCTLVRLTIR